MCPTIFIWFILCILLLTVFCYSQYSPVHVANVAADIYTSLGPSAKRAPNDWVPQRRLARRLAFRQLAALVAAIQTLLPELTLGRYESYSTTGKANSSNSPRSADSGPRVLPLSNNLYDYEWHANCNAIHNTHIMFNINAYHTTQLTY